MGGVVLLKERGSSGVLKVNEPSDVHVSPTNSVNTSNLGEGCEGPGGDPWLMNVIMYLLASK